VPLIFIGVSLALVFGTLTPANGQTSASTSTLKDAGVLRLRLGANDLFRYEPTPNSPTGAVNQTISSSSCKLNLTPQNNLVTFSPPANAGPSISPYAGFFDNSIGVGSRSEGNGQPCGRIDPAQTLTVNLGTALVGKVIDYAEIDLEGKFGAEVMVRGYFVKASDPTHPVLMKEEHYPTSGPDSSPDSGDLDNFRIRFPKTGRTAVNQLVFSIVGTTGAASLEGGADGTAPCDGADELSAGCADFSLGQTLGTTDSLFHLTEVDGVLDCGANNTATQTTDGITTTIVRQGNADGSTCVPIPFNQASSQQLADCTVSARQCIFLQKDLLDQQAQFLWTVTWAPEEGSYMEDPTQFDFGGGFHPLQLCDGDTDGNGLPNLSGTDPWCVVNTSTDLQYGPSDPNDGLVIVKETYYGLGDPVGHR
jgi:hypothetical protein